MSKELVVLTPDGSREGFALAGVLQRTVPPAELEPTLRELVLQEEIGIIAIDERLLSGLSDQRRQSLERTWPGLLLILPTPAKQCPHGFDYLRRLLQRVLGYQVRLRR